MRGVFNTALTTALFLLLFFAFSGQLLLNLFGISIYSFMIAGGLLLLLLSIRALLYGSWGEEMSSPENIGVVPIAFPLLAGPGAITTTIMILQTSGLITTILSSLIVFFITWVVMRLVRSIYKVIGRIGASVISRVMAVFIAAIAIQFILDGLDYLF